MKTRVKVELVRFTTLKKLPQSWSYKNFKELLQIMEYDDVNAIAENELEEMCLLALTDNEPEDAAKIVLEYIFKDRLKKGQIENLSNEMLEDNMWEEYADLSLHEEFFNVHQLLYQAYNGKFPPPEAVQFSVKITYLDNRHPDSFVGHTEAYLLRLLVNGLPENTILNRLFDQQMEDGEFKEAKDIIWQLTIEKQNENEIMCHIISSEYWLHDIKYMEDFEVTI